jgi:chloride channel protein, CIC family
LKPFRTVYQQIFSFIRHRLSRPQYIILMATITGLVSGMAAVLLKTMVHYLQALFSAGHWYYILLPMLGLLLTAAILRLFFHQVLEKGIGMVLRAIAKKSSYIPTSNTYKHVITSSLTVGLGGSAGLEAPIVATGASYGSLFGRINDLNYAERSLMIACGASAGIAAVFNAPIAGVIFAIEVLITETVVSYFIPLMIASVVGALCSKIILQESILFNFVLKQDFNYVNVPFYILLGIMSGFVSLYYAKMFKGIEKKLQAFALHSYLKAVAGGLLLAGLIFILPPLFGEGYQSISLLANNNTAALTSFRLFDMAGNDFSLLLFIGAIMLLKPVAAAITIGSGGNGGNFAPSLFVGASLGFFFSRLLNTTGLVKLPESNFSLTAMAGVLSGVMYCPLTAIFLIAEITSGYGLFIPLMIVSSISFFIVKHFEPYSMELKKLVAEGEVFTHRKEQNILTAIELSSLLTDQYPVIPIHQKLDYLVAVIKKSEKNIFAVTDEKDRFVGIIELNDIKKLLFEKEKHGTVTIKSIAKRPRDTIFSDESMQKVMEKFDSSQTWYLPVLDRNRKFLGFISKTRLFEQYRTLLGEKKDLYES